MVFECLEQQGLGDLLQRAGDSPKSTRNFPLSRSVACTVSVTPFVEVSTLVSASRSSSLPARLSA